jgi:hypothetical protein
MGGEKLIQLAATIFNPQAPLPPEAREAASKFYIGGVNILSDIMEFLGNTNGDDYLPYIKNLEFMTDYMEQMKDQELQQIKAQAQAQGGANGGGQQADQAGGGQMGPGIQPSGGPDNGQQ